MFDKKWDCQSTFQFISMSTLDFWTFKFSGTWSVILLWPISYLNLPLWISLYHDNWYFLTKYPYKWMFSVLYQSVIGLSFLVFEILRFIVSSLNFFSGLYFVNVQQYSLADVIEDLSFDYKLDCRCT